MLCKTLRVCAFVIDVPIDVEKTILLYSHVSIKTLEKSVFQVQQVWRKNSLLFLERILTQTLFEGSIFRVYNLLFLKAKALLRPILGLIDGLLIDIFFLSIGFGGQL